MLVDAGGTPCALDALCVRGVEQAEGQPVLRDLSEVLGGAPEAAHGLAVALDVPAGQVLRVRSVQGVVDVSSARAYALPQGISPRLARRVRGVLELEGRLFLDVDLLALEGEAPPAEERRCPPPSSEVPAGKVLVFKAGAGVWAVPLGQVTQVVAAVGMCPTPGRTVALLVHDGGLWPVYGFGSGVTGLGCVVLLEVAGRPLGVYAEQVLGIVEQLVPTVGPDTGSVPWTDGVAAGLDLGMLFA